MVRAEADLTLKHDGDLVLAHAHADVGRHYGARHERVLHDRHRAAGVGAVDLEVHADAGCETPGLGFARQNDL